MARKKAEGVVLNFISWNGAAPKLDLREWSPEHDKMGKGITMNIDEAHELKKILDKYFDGEMF